MHLVKLLNKKYQYVRLHGYKCYIEDNYYETLKQPTGCTNFELLKSM
jgi:hypothetical protein